MFLNVFFGLGHGVRRGGGWWLLGCCDGFGDRGWGHVLVFDLNGLRW